MLGTLSDEGTGPLALASAAILGSKSCGTHDHILISQIRGSQNLEGQVPAFIFPRSRVAQLYSQALGFLFVASYDSQGYGGGIQTSLHAGIPPAQMSLNFSLILRPTVSRPVYLGLKYPSGTYDQVFVTVRQLRVC
jgi:hypothetical protein